MATSLSAPTLTSSKRWGRERWKTLERLFQVGRGVAHDEYIEFSIEGNTILYQVLTPANFFLLQFYVFFPKRSSSILCHNLITTQGWREWDQRREDPGWVHQELQGQPQDQRHRPHQGEGAKDSFQPLTAALWLFRGPWRTSPSWPHSLLSQRRMKLPMISKFVQIIFRTGLFWYWSNPKVVESFPLRLNMIFQKWFLLYRSQLPREGSQVGPELRILTQRKTARPCCQSSWQSELSSLSCSASVGSELIWASQLSLYELLS